jgi:hypothetical protein
MVGVCVACVAPGCSPRRAGFVDLADAFLGTNGLTVIKSDLQCVDKTSFANHARNIDFDRHTITAYSGTVTNGSFLVISNRTILTQSQRTYRSFFATPDPSVFLELRGDSRNQSPNMHLSIFDPLGGTKTNELHWDFKTSLLPRRHFLFNRSRSIIAIHDGRDVLLYDCKSLAPLNRTFSHPKIQNDLMDHACLSDDGSLLFVEWDEPRSKTNAISIFDQNGTERLMAPLEDACLIDAEKTSEGVAVIFRDGLASETILKYESDKKEFRARYAEKIVWNYKMGVIYFLGDLTGLPNSDRLVSWDYKKGILKTGFLKL